MGKYLRNFSSLEEANAQGTEGLDSPHVDIIDGCDAVNYIIVETEKFTCSFGEDCKIKDVQPIEPIEPVEPVEPENEPVKVTVTHINSSGDNHEVMFAARIKGTAPISLPNIQYSTDGINYDTLTWDSNGETNKIPIEVGSILYFKGNNPQGFSYHDGVNGDVRQEIQFVYDNGNDVYSGGNINTEVEGNIMSLIGPYAKTIPCNGCFRALFTCAPIPYAYSAYNTPKGIILLAENVLPATYANLFYRENLIEGELTCLAKTGLDETDAFKNFLSHPYYTAPNLTITVADGMKTTWQNSGLLPQETTIIEINESEPEYEMVDLGLPSGTKWADRNIGAESPEDYGKFFQFGDTVGHYAYEGYIFSKENCPFYDSATGTWTKYNNIGVKQTLEPEDDAANVILGNGWRIPSVEEGNELIANVDYVVEEREDGSYKATLTSKINGNSIVIVGGYINNNNNISSSILSDGRTQLYINALSDRWPSGNNFQNRYYMGKWQDEAPIIKDGYQRHYGIPIRPVHN